MSSEWHIPVLTKEVIDFLGCSSNGLYVDATLGGGGWAEAILKASGPHGKLIGFDRDQDALNESQKRLAGYSERFECYQAEFSKIVPELKRMGLYSVDGVVADLGVSSHQLEGEGRGFSFSRPEKLDMRMDREGDVDAYRLVNTSSADQLEDWFSELGEERFSRRIVKLIMSERGKKPIETTAELADIVFRAVPPPAKHGRIHPATRVFQALRIVVNDELREIKSLVETMPGILKTGGRLIIVSYHSLEDRIVKHGFRAKAATEDFKCVTKRSVRPTEEEIIENRRARSAHLRVLEKSSSPHWGEVR